MKRYLYYLQLLQVKLNKNSVNVTILKYCNIVLKICLELRTLEALILE